MAPYRLSEPTRRGKRFNWNKDDNGDDEAKQEQGLRGPEVVKCPDDVCIVC
jgi:hypothetical protein